VNKLEDESLVELVLDGDDQAMRILYDRYFQPLFQYAYLQMGDYHVAEEVTQDIFCKMARNLHTFQGKSTFKTWLYSIGRNVVIDHHRKLKRHKRAISMPEVNVEMLVKQVPFQENHDSTNELEEEVLDCLKKLPDDYRTVIHLRFIEDFSIADTAKVMSKTVLAVKSLQHRAKKRLLELLEREVREI
jgi:RNA polymerase sigma-70 factor (ECF subfamily)